MTPHVAFGASSFLAAATNFAVLGNAAVTNVGATSVTGDLGIWPGTSVTGLGTIVLTGALHVNDATAQQAQLDATAAYNTLILMPFTQDLTGQDLGTLGPLTPGVYQFDSSAQLTGSLVLDAQNNPNALFVFQIGTALTTATAASVQVINGGANTGVYWQLGSSATLGTATIFAGNILAHDSITLITSASITCGRAIALNAAVTLGTNVISNDCGSSITRNDFGSSGFSGFAVPTPEPGTYALMGFALAGLVGFRRVLNRKCCKCETPSSWRALLSRPVAATCSCLWTRRSTCGANAGCCSK
ncbi:MAG: DUF3494 domain-containing protein [Acidobacteriota bacterium]